MLSYISITHVLSKKCLLELVEQQELKSNSAQLSTQLCNQKAHHRQLLFRSSVLNSSLHSKRHNRNLSQTYQNMWDCDDQDKPFVNILIKRKTVIVSTEEWRFIKVADMKDDWQTGYGGAWGVNTLRHSMQVPINSSLTPSLHIRKHGKLFTIYLRFWHSMQNVQVHFDIILDDEIVLSSIWSYSWYSVTEHKLEIWLPLQQYVLKLTVNEVKHTLTMLIDSILLLVLLYLYFSTCVA